MKFLARLLPLAVFVCLLPSAKAADLSGAWKGAFDFQDQQVSATLRFAVSGSMVTGTVEGLPTSPAAIHDGRLNGGVLTFWVNTDYDGETYKLLFTGKVSEAKIDFNFGTDDGSWGTEMSVRRENASAPDVTGTWKGTFDLFGADTPVTFNLKSDGATVTGSVTSADGKGNEIHDGKIDGKTVTFWVNTEYQGEDYVVQYKGTITDEGIEFNFGIPDGSWSSSVKAKKA